MKATLEIRLLGDFSFEQEGCSVAGLDSPRLQALLAYLLLHRGVPQLRQHLAFLFWLDSDEAQARTNLRNLIHRLRHAWPNADHYVAIENRTLSWRSEAHFTLDVADFEMHLQRVQTTERADEQIQHLQRATDLYHADLLPSCYDDWIQPERARLRQAYVHALEASSDLLANRGDYPAAIHAAERLIQAEPLQEAAYRRLLDLHTRNGDRAAALKVYRRCVTTLLHELELAPDAVTQAAYRNLLMPGAPAGDPSIPPVPLDAPLVGRNGEWEQLLLAWRLVTAGRRPSLVVLIRGEAGVGKTRLAAELADWLELQSMTVASAACYAAEMELSLMPVAAWLRTLSMDNLPVVWRAELARLLPELSDGAPASVQQRFQAGLGSTRSLEPWQKRRFYEGLAKAILRQAQPVLLRLEDIHWCDAETLAWLHYLLHLDEDARLMVVATLRDEEVDLSSPLVSMLSALRREGRLLEIDLAPLDSAGTAALAAGLLGEALSPEAAAALHRHTEGNPLFIVETVCRDLECGGSASTIHTLVEAAHSPAWAAPAPLSPKIQAVLRDRLARLTPGACTLLEAACVIGRSFTGDILSHTIDVGEVERVAALDELWRRRIVRTRDGAAYDFSHDILRQTVYAALGPARRRWLHSRVARALEIVGRAGSEEHLGQLALHYDAAGHTQKAFYTHLQAAESAQRLYAFPTAAFHLQRAIVLLDRVVHEDTEHARLHEQLGDFYTLMGRHDEARQAFGTAMSALRPHSELVGASLLLKVAETWLAQYELDKAWETFEKVLENLGNPEGFSSVHWHTWLDARLGQLDVLYYGADTERMAALIGDMGSSLELYGSLQQRANYYLMCLEFESRQTRFCLGPEAVATCRRAVSLAEGSGDENLYQRSRFGLGFLLLWSGEVEPAARELADIAATSESVGNIPLLDRSLAYLTTAYRLLGQTDKVRHLLPRCLAVAENEKNALYLGVARANQAWLAYRAGVYGEAATHARFALQQWDKLVFPFHWLARWPLLAQALECGDVVASVAHARGMLRPEQQKLPDEIEAALTAALALRLEKPQLVAEKLEVALSAARRLGYL
jgi:DNA-binding SARP family transcriptional activator/tetratricopeptide (TPR) repeat protein